MRAVVLSAVPANHPLLSGLPALLASELAWAGHADLEAFDLTTTRLAFCQGEFDCWVKTPGRCRSQDAETDIVGAVHDADALVLLGPVTFGGHGHVLKRALDRFICLLEPFFTQRLSLTHHDLRYGRGPSLFSIGWMRDPSPAIAATYAELNDANAVNFVAPRCGALILDEAHAEGWGAAIRGLLEAPRTPGADIDGRAPLREALLAAAAPDAGAVGPARVERAALLVGSAKAKGTSASEALARALAARLERGGVATELHFATEFVHEDAAAVAAARSIAACDLFVLVTPLYVDSLPALATHALELVARERAASPSPGRFVALVNCGFPEPEQNRTAMRLARHFAEEAGYAWGGGLPLGGGGVTLEGPLDAPHEPVAHIVRALDLAGPALAVGGAVPRRALEAITDPSLPESLYRVMGDLGWRWEAHRNGLAQRALHARPLDRPPPA